MKRTVGVTLLFAILFLVTIGIMFSPEGARPILLASAAVLGPVIIGGFEYYINDRIQSKKSVLYGVMLMAFYVVVTNSYLVVIENGSIEFGSFVGLTLLSFWFPLVMFILSFVIVDMVHIDEIDRASRIIDVYKIVYTVLYVFGIILYFFQVTGY